MTFFSKSESFETPKPLKKFHHDIKEHFSCVAASVVFYHRLHSLSDTSEPKILSDLDVISTRRLSISRHIRYHCSTKSTNRSLRVFFKRGFRIISGVSRLQSPRFNAMLFERGFFLQSHKVIRQAFSSTEGFRKWLSDKGKFSPFSDITFFDVCSKQNLCEIVGPQIFFQ